MNAPRFIDINILPYSISRDAAEASKREIAITLFDSENIALSVQVLQEFYVQATRATRPDAPAHEIAVGLLRPWLRFKVQEITLPVMIAAFEIKAIHGQSYWDAAKSSLPRAHSAAASCGLLRRCCRSDTDCRTISTPAGRKHASRCPVNHVRSAADQIGGMLDRPANAHRHRLDFLADFFNRIGHKRTATRRQGCIDFTSKPVKEVGVERFSGKSNSRLPVQHSPTCPLPLQRRP